MYKSKKEVKANVEKARKTNYWRNREHYWFDRWRKLDKIQGKKPTLYIPYDKY